LNNDSNWRDNLLVLFKNGHDLEKIK